MRSLLVFSAAAMLAVVAACGGGSSESTPAGSQSAGGLTDDQRQKLAQIVQTDPVISELAGGAQITLQDIGPWSAGTVPETGEETFIGGVATVVLSQKIGHLERDLPFATIRPYYTSWSASDRAKYTPYKEGIVRLAADNLSRLHVNVDIDRGKIAAIRVLPEQQYAQRVAVVPFDPAPLSTAGVTQAATDIVNADPRVAALLAGRPNTSGDGNTYSIVNTHFAADAYHFNTPQTLEADWPLLFEFDQRTGAYQSTVVHFKATEVDSLSVVVDLDKGAIAWLEPIKKKATSTPTATP